MTTTPLRAPLTEELDWQLQGRCREPGHDPDLWHPARECQAGPAKAICMSCPVVVQCRSWALTHHERAGVWGGLTESEREAIWKGRPIKRRYHRKTLQDLGLA